MATNPKQTPPDRGPSPLPTGPCAGGDGKREVRAESHGIWPRPPALILAPPRVPASGLESSPGWEARAACRDTRPAQPVLPSCAAVARSAFLPRWWRWARGDYRRRQGLLPIARIPTHHTSLARAPCHRVVIADPGARHPPPTYASPLPTPVAGSGATPSSSSQYLAACSPCQEGLAAPQCGQTAAASDECRVFGGLGAPFPGLGFQRRKRGSRMSPGGGGSERERGGGGRRRWARATTTSEAAAAARAAAQARGRRQVSIAADSVWARSAFSPRSPFLPLPSFGTLLARIGIPSPTPTSAG